MRLIKVRDLKQAFRIMYESMCAQELPENYYYDIQFAWIAYPAEIDGESAVKCADALRPPFGIDVNIRGVRVDIKEDLPKHLQKYYEKH